MYSLAVNPKMGANFVHLRAADIPIMVYAASQILDALSADSRSQMPKDCIRHLDAAIADHIFLLIRSVDAGLGIKLGGNDLSVVIGANERTFFVEALDSFRVTAHMRLSDLASIDAYYQSCGRAEEFHKKIDSRIDEIICKLRGLENIDKNATCEEP